MINWTGIKAQKLEQKKTDLLLFQFCVWSIFFCSKNLKSEAKKNIYFDLCSKPDPNYLKNIQECCFAGVLYLWYVRTIDKFFSCPPKFWKNYLTTFLCNTLIQTTFLTEQNWNWVLKRVLAKKISVFLSLSSICT